MAQDKPIYALVLTGGAVNLKSDFSIEAVILFNKEEDAKSFASKKYNNRPDIFIGIIEADRDGVE